MTSENSANRTSLFSERFGFRFWIINIFQMLERMAYVVVLMQMPIYISQKDVPGGLHWEQSVKGFIFFCWALVQNLVPILSGGYAEKYGYKKVLVISLFIILASYVILYTQRAFYPFLAGIIILGLGSGLFKPVLQGSLSNSLSKRNQSVGWGIYFMLINLAVFFGYTLSKHLRSMSWQLVFIGAVIITSVNLIIMILFFKSPEQSDEAKFESPLFIFKNIFRTLIQSKLLMFVLFMSGFTLIYMQFYETLPNFLVDWTDTSHIVQRLKLPEYMTMATNRGIMISYEWLYNLNSFLIILAVVFVSWAMSKQSRIKGIIIGIFLAMTGLLISGFTTNGWFAIAGIIVYTFGEMITNPKFAEHLSVLAGDKDKALFMSYLNISLTIGLALGSVAGGYLYGHFGEKASLAYKHLASHNMLNYDTSLKNAMDVLIAKSGLTASGATEMLWREYHPYYVWIPFVLVGFVSIAGLIAYNRKQKPD